jgi:hypothetical protein
MVLATVIAVVLVIVGIAVYQWVRPPGGGKASAGEHDLTSSEAYGGMTQQAKSNQFEPPGC